VVLEGAWVTGVFDRVIVECDAEARPVRATVFDFKTDRVGPEDDLATSAQRHSGQLAVYRRVVAMLTGIPPERVTCEVVFTRVRRRVEVGF
jgi:ATP-dependent exoDNAse (exonuclease V) beta subunit